ncbi:DUF3054 family protein, partial [Staphylococcus aureus]|uniref:DUF3054 family protein n=1 Tax=Staphylococcus aureus TaxID=1280 RepID=UPI001E361ACA
MAALADASCVAVFAAAGRGSHAADATLSGLLGTAAPFWLGAGIGWLAARAWRSPASLPTGVV